MSREQKIEVLIDLISKMPESIREEVISLIAYIVRTQ